MSGLRALIALGKEIGLEGLDLQTFVKEKEAAEREERAREREARQRELEAERARQDFELKKLELGRGRRENDDLSQAVKPSFPKLPVFDENTDSIDAYLLRFERLAASAKWEKEMWAISLASLLRGKALETYQLLSPGEARDYEEVKQALLKSFQCTAEGYRLKFRNSKFVKGETASQFGGRIKNFLNRWLELAECEETYEDLLDIMLIEQFTKVCDKSLVLFLKEHELKTFPQVLKLADLYMEAHGNTAKDSTRSEVKEKEGTEHQEKTTGNKPYMKRNSGLSCFVCGRSNHTAKDCFYRYGSKNKDNRGRKGDVDKAAAVKTTGLVVDEGTVEGNAVQVLRDQGCTTVLVKRALVPKTRLTGKQVKLQMANGMMVTCPEALINVVTPYYSGETLAACMKRPVYDLVIGNVEGVNDDGDETVNAVVTRSQSQVEGSKKVVNLRIHNIMKDVTKRDLIQMQQSDKTLSKIRGYVTEERVFKRVGKDDHYFVEKRGIIYCRVDKDGCKNDQLVVPRGLRKSVMKLAHSSLMGGHLGRKKTLDRIRDKFMWPGMSSEVGRFCRSCDACQRTVDKGRVPKVKLGRMPIIDEPFKRVAVDIVGPLEPRASDGSRYILTIVDYATRYPEAVALKSCDTVSVAEALLSVFSRVGIPREILSDRGTQFTSEMMQEFLRLLSVKGLTTTPYHAMCNGLVERFNGVLKKMLRRMSHEQPKEWHRYLDPLLFAYREVPQASTTLSPFELIYGHTVRGPLSLVREAWEEEEGMQEGDDKRTVFDYLINLRERLSYTCKIARDELEKAGETYRAYYNRGAKERTLTTGQKALVLLPTSSNKLLMQWKGPYEVLREVNKCNYVLAINGQQKKYHINMLKRYYDREEEDTSEIASTAVAIEDEMSEESNIEVIPSYEQKENKDNVKVNDQLSNEQCIEVKELLEQYTDVFSDVPGRTSILNHRIKVNDSKPVRSKPYPIPYAIQGEVEKELQQMLDLGIIEPSESPYSSPMLIVKKKDGGNRLCLDFRKLNKLTVFDAEPMPDIAEIMTQLSNSKYFTRIDLSKGYWQIPLDRNSRELTAFQTSKGLFQFVVMPFGLISASATFNRLMRMLLSRTENVRTFVDDVLIFTTSWDDHVKKLQEVFEILSSAGLTARPTKCEIGYYHIEYLGHQVGEGLSKPLKDQVTAITALEVPKSKKEVRSFLGMVGFYRQYIPAFSTIACPLTDLTKKSAPNKVVWEEDHQKAFEELKGAVSKYPVLRLVDFSKEFVVQADASGVGIGAVLMQAWDEELRPVAYASRKLNNAERNYSTIEKECLAIVWCVKKFYRYLYGRHFTIETDHQPLRYLQRSDHANGRLMRWSMYLQQFNFTICNIKGSDNASADCLSRLC